MEEMKKLFVLKCPKCESIDCSRMYKIKKIICHNCGYTDSVKKFIKWFLGE